MFNTITGMWLKPPYLGDARFAQKFGIMKCGNGIVFMTQAAKIVFLAEIAVAAHKGQGRGDNADFIDAVIAIE